MTRKKAAPPRAKRKPRRRRNFSAVALWPLVALVVFAVLLGVALHTRSQEQPAQQQATVEPIWSESIDNVASITTSFTDNGAFTLEPTGDAYQLTDPRQLPVDQDFGKALFSVLSTVKPVRLVDDNAGDRLSEFGLDQPYGSVTVNLDDGTTHTLLVGDASPVSEGDTPNRYAMEKDSGKVYLVSGIDVQIMDRTLEQWRDHDVLKLDVDSVREVHVEQGQDTPSTFTLDYNEKPEDGFTWVAKNDELTAPASTTTVRDFLAAYDQLKVEKFVDDNPADLKKYGLDTPTLTLTFKQEGVDKPEVISFGLFADNQGQMVYAKNSRWPFVFTVSTSIFSKANPVVYGVIELKPMMPVASPRLDEIEWTPTTGDAVRLSKAEADKTMSEAKWTRTVGSGEPTELDSDTVLEIVRQVLALEASNREAMATGADAQNPDKYGLTPPAGVLHVHWTADDNQPGGDISLTIGTKPSAEATSRYFTVGDYHIVYSIGETPLTNMLDAVTGSK